MSEDFERQLGDLISDGRITDEDADIARTFAQFLTEAGPPPITERRPGDPWPPELDTAEKRQAWRQRWMPYLQGEAGGPIDSTAAAARRSDTAAETP